MPYDTGSSYVAAGTTVARSVSPALSLTATRHPLLCTAQRSTGTHDGGRREEALGARLPGRRPSVRARPRRRRSAIAPEIRRAAGDSAESIRPGRGLYGVDNSSSSQTGGRPAGSAGRSSSLPASEIRMANQATLTLTSSPTLALARQACHGLWGPTNPVPWPNS